MLPNSKKTNSYNATVIFAHGKESGPQGEKIEALSAVAQDCGFESFSPDFRGMEDPEDRVRHLLEFLSSLQGPFILVGSSMGGYVMLRASGVVPTKGLFLMAPAVALPWYPVPEPTPGSKNISIVHAWQDELIAAGNVIRFAQEHRAALHLVNSDHRLSGQMPLLQRLFALFLKAC